MKKFRIYYSSYDQAEIKEIEVERETAKSVWVFDTFDEAQRQLESWQLKRVDNLRQRLLDAETRLTDISLLSAP